jgi:hypothetical protein
MRWHSKTIVASVLFTLACIGVLAFSSAVRSEEDRAWVSYP